MSLILFSSVIVYVVEVRRVQAKIRLHNDRRSINKKTFADLIWGGRMAE